MILVTGGAGYIGSHTVLMLQQRGHRVVVLDDLSEGHREALFDVEMIEGSTLDAACLARVFEQYPIRAVCHFAARCYVGESVEDPGLYYHNNVVGTLNLLRAMVAAEVRNVVFSSTCATFGVPDQMPIVEDMPQVPINPYGETKLVCERMLRDFAVGYGLSSVALRYFNAAGADPEGRIGEDHDPETHLIPLVLEVAAGKRDKLTVFGGDYETIDGTCVRDYVHVTDLAEAHLLALAALDGGMQGATSFNLGNERGTSVLEVIESVRSVTGKDVPYEIGARRPGDPPVLVGSLQRIQTELGWEPALGDINSIVETAWNWHRLHPGGYSS
ncbi:MAG: UDP-glucose 4-epimerase GalE [Planctomycetota bacterium]|nr:UDP-glucose 4-epimerase GalE [Planctomycetota bacterium]